MSCPLDIYPYEIENVDPHNIHSLLMQPPSLSTSVESNSEDETPGIQLNDGPSQTQPLVRRENSTSYGNEDFFPPFHEIITPHMSPKKMPNTALESLSNNHPTSVIPVSADYVDESAIDDEDDSSDWGDSIEDSNKSSIDEKTFFQRVDSKPNLASRRSLITLMIDHQARTNNSAQSTLATSPSDSDDSLLMMKHGNESSSPKLTNEVPRSAAQPFLARHSESCPLIPTSPRTTRRNMLATELTESLRRNLLLERQQKYSTANAVLKRRHTSHEVANLTQYPEKAYINENEDIPDASYDFSKDGGYHSKGW